MFLRRSKKTFSYVIAGLGNPGAKYAFTRHNAGFRVINRLLEEIGSTQDAVKKRDGYLGAEVKINDIQVVLIQPVTFMNRSGKAVAAALRRYELPPGQLLLVYDDLDLSPGVIRIKVRGGSGGHRGVASVIETLNEGDFPRLRIGVGRPPEGTEVYDYVLSPPTGEEARQLETGEQLAAEAVVGIISEGAEDAMNKYNRRAG